MEVTSSSQRPPVYDVKAVQRKQAQEEQQKTAQRKEAMPEQPHHRPQPVRNTQGQTTGRILNTSA